MGMTYSISRGAPPNDPDFHLQWALHNTGQVVSGAAGLPGADIDAVAAWDLHAGGSPIIVAIVGAGVDSHPEYADRLLDGFVTSLGGGDPYSSLETAGQGTRVAGIIAAARDDGVGIAGMNPHVTLLPIRALNGIVGGEPSVAEGIVRAADSGAEIILVPLQFGGGTAALSDAVAYAAAAGSLVIAPAGNNGDSTVAYPARFSGCMAVSATTSGDSLALFSNTGAEVEIAAPSLNIWSTSRFENYSFEPQSNGSFAAAYVAGAASLVWSYAPQLTANQVRQILLDSADDLGPPGRDIQFGFGRLNVRRALEMTPRPPLRFELLDSLPAFLIPNEPTTAMIRISDGSQTVVPHSPLLVYRIVPGGVAPPIPLRHLEGNLFAVDFPPIPCGTIIEYYLSATTTQSFTVFEPRQAPAAVRTAPASEFETIFHDDFETDRGWTTVVEGGPETRGAWERVIPIGSMAGNVQVQTAYDYSPNAKQFCYLTGQYFGGPVNSSDLFLGPVRLVSPTIELASTDAEIRFAAWVFSVSGNIDSLFVDVSRDDGATWHLAMEIQHTGNWNEYDFRLSEVPGAIGNQLKVRFSIADNPNDSLTEAAIDEFTVAQSRCARLGDMNGDGKVDWTDWRPFSHCLSGPLVTPDPLCEAADLNADGTRDLLDAAMLLALFSIE